MACLDILYSETFPPFLCQENGVGVVKVTGLAVKDASGKLKRVHGLQRLDSLARWSNLDSRSRTCLTSKKRPLPSAPRLQTWMSRWGSQKLKAMTLVFLSSTGFQETSERQFLVVSISFFTAFDKGDKRDTAKIALRSVG